MLANLRWSIFVLHKLMLMLACKHTDVKSKHAVPEEPDRAASTVLNPNHVL